MKILVTGGRDYHNADVAKRVLEGLRVIHAPNLEICHGGAAGADTLADVWAGICGIPCKVYKADWEQHGKRAGVIRNAFMLQDFRPDLVVAFPGGKGTEDMVSRATAAAIPVMKVRL